MFRFNQCLLENRDRPPLCSSGISHIVPNIHPLSSRHVTFGISPATAPQLKQYINRHMYTHMCVFEFVSNVITKSAR